VVSLEIQHERIDLGGLDQLFDVLAEVLAAQRVVRDVQPFDVAGLVNLDAIRRRDYVSRARGCDGSLPRIVNCPMFWRQDGDRQRGQRYGQNHANRNPTLHWPLAAHGRRGTKSLCLLLPREQIPMHQAS
jgi:hypothetical protein